MTLRKVFPLVMLADEISGPFLGTPRSQVELFTPGGYHESRWSVGGEVLEMKCTPGCREQGRYYRAVFFKTTKASSYCSWGSQGKNIHWKDWCWSWSPNTLVTWCEKPTHWKRSWFWERLEAKRRGRGRGWVSLSKPWEMVKGREAWHAAVHGVAKTRTWLSDWTTTKPLQDKLSILWSELKCKRKCKELPDASPCLVDCAFLGRV